MFKKRVLGLALVHRTFVDFLVLWTFLIGDFLALWPFLTPAYVD